MSRHILVVDDEPDFSELLQFRLRNCRYEVQAATNGAEALEKIRQHAPDLILMDLMLPDLDGLTLCAILRRQETTCGTPIIMMSALSTDVARCSAKIAGARAFIPKPVDFEHLIRQVESMLNSPGEGIDVMARTVALLRTESTSHQANGDGQGSGNERCHEESQSQKPHLPAADAALMMSEE